MTLPEQKGISADSMSAMRMRARVLLVFIVLLVISGCGRSVGAPSNSYTEFSAQGPYAAGTAQFEIANDRVVVWYPVAKASVAGRTHYTYRLRSWMPASVAAAIPSTFDDSVTEDAYRGVAVARGSFPVVLFSHGYGGYPEQSSFLTAHLATWGMIVVAPDQQRRDLSAVLFGQAPELESPVDVNEQLAALSLVKQLGKTKGSAFFGHVDASRVATLGYSAGGGTAIKVAETATSVRGWISLAGVPVSLPSKVLPSLMMSASADKTVPASDVQKVYNSDPRDKKLVVLDGYGDNVFDDLCTIDRAGGGLSTAVRSLHVPSLQGIAQLAGDGCESPASYPPTAWPLVDQVVTAQLRYDFAPRGSPSTGLGPALDSAFSGVQARYSAAS